MCIRDSTLLRRQLHACRVARLRTRILCSLRSGRAQKSPPGPPRGGASRATKGGATRLSALSDRPCLVHVAAGLSAGLGRA
eukprot:9242018-Alexandrium_andersonii.AAC.1